MISHFYLYHQKKQGNQLQVDKDVLDKFPFPIIDINSTTDKQSYENVISFVHKLIDLKNEYAIADAHFKVKGGSEDLFGEKPKAVQKEIEKYSQELDNVINGLYHLNNKQIESVKLWHDQLFSATKMSDIEELAFDLLSKDELQLAATI